MASEAAPAARRPAAAEEEDCCAICFEQRPFISLPCACRMNYCAGCWDRSLAVSVTVRGRAQCPSCRSAFRVDFDPATGGVVFTIDAEGTGTEAVDWRSRMYVKARPVQVQLLRQYGAAMGGSSCRGVHQQEHGGSAGSTALAAVPPPSPLCVCGAELQRVSSEVRMEQVLDDALPGWRRGAADNAAVVQHLMDTAEVTCDLCDGVATRTGHVWTCKIGSHALLHPAAYDICERCFQRHAGLAPHQGMPTSGSGACRVAKGEAPPACLGCLAPLARWLPPLCRSERPRQ